MSYHCDNSSAAFPIECDTSRNSILANVVSGTRFLGELFFSIYRIQTQGNAAELCSQQSEDILNTKNVRRLKLVMVALLLIKTVSNEINGTLLLHIL